MGEWIGNYYNFCELQTTLGVASACSHIVREPPCLHVKLNTHSSSKEMTVT
jgi:hypothetical protein